MNRILRRSLAAAGACIAALAAASCGPPTPRNTGVYMLLDTSGTYHEELDKAKQIINFTLSRLDALDTFAVARIDTGSFSERDIMAKVTLDDRPSAANQQKREFAQAVDRFLDETPKSPYTDITGGLLQAVTAASDRRSIGFMTPPPPCPCRRPSAWRSGPATDARSTAA